MESAPFCRLVATCQNGLGQVAGPSECSSRWCKRYGQQVVNVNGQLSCVGAADGVSVCRNTVRMDWLVMAIMGICLFVDRWSLYGNVCIVPFVPAVPSEHCLDIPVLLDQRRMLH